MKKGTFEYFMSCVLRYEVSDMDDLRNAIIDLERVKGSGPLTEMDYKVVGAFINADLTWLKDGYEAYKSGCRLGYIDVVTGNGEAS